MALLLLETRRSRQLKIAEARQKLLDELAGAVNDPRLLAELSNVQTSDAVNLTGWWASYVMCIDRLVCMCFPRVRVVLASRVCTLRSVHRPCMLFSACAHAGATTVTLLSDGLGGCCCRKRAGLQANHAPWPLCPMNIPHPAVTSRVCFSQCFP